MIMGADLRDCSSVAAGSDSEDHICGKPLHEIKDSSITSSLMSLDSLKLDDIKEISDPFCNPDHPIVINFHDVTSAAFKIRGGVEYTPCNHSHLSGETGMDIYLKKEYLQYTGSFKERGARYCLLQLSEAQKKKGVISASLGNHAQGVCYHGMKLNIPTTVVMPVTAPIMKIAKCKSFGANVIIKVRVQTSTLPMPTVISKKLPVNWITGSISKILEEITFLLIGCQYEGSQTTCNADGKRPGSTVRKWLRSSAHYGGTGYHWSGDSRTSTRR